MPPCHAECAETWGGAGLEGLEELEAELEPVPGADAAYPYAPAGP